MTAPIFFNIVDNEKAVVVVRWKMTNVKKLLELDFWQEKIYIYGYGKSELNNLQVDCMTSVATDGEPFSASWHRIEIAQLLELGQSI